MYGGKDTRTWPRLENSETRAQALRDRDPVAAEDVEESFFAHGSGSFGRLGGGERVAEMRDRRRRDWGRAEGGAETGERGSDQGRRLTTGGATESWQSRLLGVLRAERQSRRGTRGREIEPGETGGSHGGS